MSIFSMIYILLIETPEINIGIKSVLLWIFSVVYLRMDSAACELAMEICLNSRGESSAVE